MKPKEMAFAVYAVSNLALSREFYENVLGFVPENVWIDEKSGMGMIEYGFGPDNVHTLAIGSGAEYFTPGKNGATVAIEVENFDDSIQSLKNANVQFVMDAHETAVCHMAIFLDLDDNQLMIHKRK